MFMRARDLCVATSCSLGLILAACGVVGDDDDDTDRSDTEASNAVLEVQHPIEPPNLFPYVPHGGKWHIYNAILTRIIEIDDAGELYSPILESWDISGDAKTITLGLRPDVEWTDGTPMTSADVIMSLTNILDGNLYPYLGTVIGEVVGQAEFNDGKAQEIAGLSARDERTIVVELESPSPGWLRKLATVFDAFVLPAHILSNIEGDQLEEHDYFENFPVTSGPYRFVEWVPGQHIELERNDQWYLGEVGFERVFFKFMAADAAEAQLEAGEVQFIMEPSAADVERIGSLEGIEVASTPQSAIIAWYLRPNDPLLDKRVRQAMVYAIDREAICRDILNGYCTVPTANIPSNIPNWAMPTTDVLEYAFDPARARELLKEAEWDPNTELTLLAWEAPDSELAAVLTVAQDQLADVGINWTIEYLDVPTFNERVEQEPQSFDGLIEGFAEDADVDPDFVTNRLSCDTHFPSGANYGHYCNAELDELLAAGRTEPNEEIRAEIYQDAFRLTNSEVPAILLYQEEMVVAYDARLTGVVAGQRYGSIFSGIGEWRWEE
ncbi:ABC transporter substrate-binding protein [Phytoactinopolyspora endophytica]|uniref:ABC transporter substrate-binding protein n=1 Tax=Phytoactinopolyspora endophytica TaxID=1642495 RepID=UPI00101CB0AD|nr:ABC transporter substrate-binding protein [Phytoactinopolyspora endophytica]